MIDSEEQPADEKNKPLLNKQMSPLIGGAFLGGLVFALTIYRTHDILRALLVGGVVFAMIFWVMWAGQYLERRSKTKKDVGGQP